jgi:benzoyl-CoA reductase/2-hydroxyglutaryl-CoA dehydratase subunit BcrC/BadD/HgdB
MAEYYDDLVKLCGFDDDEIGKERPRLDKAFKKLELGVKDFNNAEEWVRRNHDVGLLGVRKLLGAWLKELVDLVLAREEGKKIVYYGFPTITGPGLAIKAAAPDEVYAACPDVVLCHTMGQIFNKLSPVLGAGEENGLPPGHGLCSLQQIRNGGMAKGIIPVPDLVLTSSYYCDMGSKADELLHEKYGHPAVYVDGCMDSRWGEYPGYLSERVEFLGAQLNKLFAKVKEILGVEVTREVWDKAASISRQLFSGISRLAELLKADPMPASQVAVGLAMWLSAGSTGRAMSEGPAAIAILCEEIRKRVDAGIGVVEKGAPRVMTIITHYSDPRVTRMIEDVGLANSVTLFSAPAPKTKSETTYTTLGEIIAEREMRLGSFHSTYGLVQRTAKAIADLNIEGVIWNYLYNCRPLAITSHLMKRWVEENVGLPTLSLESDAYDSRYYSEAALRTKVETFAEILRARKASTKRSRATT